MKKREKTYLVSILVLGVVLRVLFLESRSIQYDDAFSILLSSRSLAEIVRGTAADTMPPLYYFLLHFWGMISTRIWWLRLLSLILNMGSVWFLFLLVKNLTNTAAGLWAAFLAAVSPIQIYHAQDLRMYALLAFSQILYLWFFSQIWRASAENSRPKIVTWAGLAISGALAMYSHNLAGFLIVAPNFFLVLKKKWRLLGKLIAAQVFIAVLAAPWLWMVPGQVEKIQTAFWTPRPGLVEVLQALVLFTASLPLPGMWFAIALVLSLQILVLVVLELVRAKSSGDGVLFLAVMGLTPPLLLFVLSYVMRPVFVPRGFLISGLMYAGLAGYTIALGWQKKVGMLIAGSFVLASLISLPYQQTYREFPRSPFAEAAAALEEKIQPGDRVVHDNKLSAFPFLVYSPGLPQVFLADEPGSHNDTYAAASQKAMQIFPVSDISQAVEGRECIHFVVFSKAIEEYSLLEEGEHPQVAWLNKEFQLRNRQVYNDLEVYTFER